MLPPEITFAVALLSVEALTPIYRRAIELEDFDAAERVNWMIRCLLERDRALLVRPPSAGAARGLSAGPRLSIAARMRCAAATNSSTACATPARAASFCGSGCGNGWPSPVSSHAGEQPVAVIARWAISNVNSRSPRR